MLALARVLVERPRVLVADELSLGRAPIVVREVYQGLARIAAAGSALLLVEQQVGHALALATRAVVLSRGAVEWVGAADQALAAAEADFLHPADELT
jgi:branched-chain amino acid transport system ATP-binding protein